jgi:outer membrane protein OmpA-like peptidoglycan-associated protein
LRAKQPAPTSTQPALGSAQPKVLPAAQPKVQSGSVPPGPVPVHRTTRQPPATGTTPQITTSPVTAPSVSPRGPKPVTTQPVLTVRSVDQLRSQRKVHVEGSRRITVEPDRRMIVRDGGKPYIRHDETGRWQLLGAKPRTERRGKEQYVYVQRRGYQIITVKDGDGRLLRRMRRGSDGRDVVLFDNRRVAAVVGAGLLLGLAAPVISIPREEYIVDVSGAAPEMLYDTLDAPPLVQLERGYTLEEILQNAELRDRTRRLDIDSITFASGAWEVTQDQYPALEAVAHAMKRILSRKPNAMFLLEGHTDLVGNEDDNLSLSDRRAEAVAVALTEVFQIPPENLVTQGYGEQFPKVPTEGASRSNRRVAVRNITYLLAGRW